MTKLAMTTTDLDELARQAADGGRQALSSLIEAIRDRIFGVAIRMLGQAEDAEDATQEILVKIVTHLSTFRGESKFMTWAYRVATNHLLTEKKRSRPADALTFESFGERISQGMGAFDTFAEVQTDALLHSEIRLSCTHSMLACLEREERIAFILGAIFEVSGDEGAAILDIPSATFRKRLSRARARLVEFMQVRCGVFDGAQKCRCKKQGQVALGTGTLTRDKFRFAILEVAETQLDDADEAKEFVDLLDAARVLQTQPQYATPTGTVAMLSALVDRQGASST